MHTILVLGGYGFFGGRICAALSEDPGIHLLIGGRSRNKSIAMSRQLDLSASQAISIDANDPALASSLTALGVNTLIHTAGPFQGQDYAVARAAIDARCNYIDLADGRSFVAGIDQLNELARNNKVSVISGASSVPALSSAAIDKLLPDFQRIDRIRIGIASGARAPGLATVRGVFGYCGKPIQRWEDGVWKTTYGWLDLHGHRFPAPVGHRWLGSCDVPDLELLPRRYPSARTVTFHAGFASSLGHMAVWTLSKLVQLGVLGSVSPFARPLNGISRWMEPIVSDKGAMFVSLSGLDSGGAPLTRTWNLLAAQNHGPHIPCGASIALARKLARGEQLPRGAMPCMGLLTVDEYLAPLRDMDIREVMS